MKKIMFFLFSLTILIGPLPVLATHTTHFVVEENTPVSNLQETSKEFEEVLMKEERFFDYRQGERVKDNETPLASGLCFTWALSNLIFTLLSVLLTIILLFSKFNQKEEDDKANIKITNADAQYEKDDRIQKHKIYISILSVVISLLSTIIFIFTEDMRNPMTMVDDWTILMALIFFIQLGVFYAGKKWHDIKQKENNGRSVII